MTKTKKILITRRALIQRVQRFLAAGKRTGFRNCYELLVVIRPKPQDRDRRTRYYIVDRNRGEVTLDVESLKQLVEYSRGWEVLKPWEDCR